MGDLKEEVEKVFEKLEKERSKRVVLAVEEGSCAWGLDSPQSDHDIRFIYLSDLPYYLSIERHRQRDSLLFEEKNMDFSGWDLRKALQLCRDSNPGLLDWLRSAKVLRKEEALISDLLSLAIKNHCPKALAFHWLNTAEKHDKLFFGERKQVILKKYFYVVRPLLCIEFVRLRHLEGDFSTLPPMILKDLVHSLPKECFLTVEAKESLLELIERKTKGNLGLGERIEALDVWISKSWSFYGEFCKKMEKKVREKQFFREFDVFFQKVVHQYLLPKNSKMIKFF